MLRLIYDALDFLDELSVTKVTTSLKYKGKKSAMSYNIKRIGNY